MQDTASITCPYCGETNEIYIDHSGGRIQHYVEDCQICCHPWQVQVDLTGNIPMVNVLTSDE